MTLSNQLFQTTRKLRLFIKSKLREINTDLTFDQWTILNPLVEKNGLYQREIAARTNKDAPTLTRIIDKLCKKGLTERVIDHGDRRKFKIYLTAKGHEMVEMVTPQLNQYLNEVLSSLTDNQIANTIDALESLDNRL